MKSARLAGFLAGAVCFAPALFSQSALDQQLRAAVERKDVPGFVVVAGDRKGILYEGAFGLADSGAARPMTVDAIFAIASMTASAGRVH